MFTTKVEGIFLSPLFAKCNTIETNWLQSRLSKVPVEFTVWPRKTIFFFYFAIFGVCSAHCAGVKRTFGFSTRCRAERIFCQLWTHCHSNYCWIESQLCRPRVGVHSQDFLHKRKKDQLLTPKWKLSVIYHTIGDIWWDMMANPFSLLPFRFFMGWDSTIDVRSIEFECSVTYLMLISRTTYIKHSVSKLLKKASFLLVVGWLRLSWIDCRFERTHV